MRRELLTFAVDPPVLTPQADPDVARVLSAIGGTIVGVFPSGDGDELAVVVELDDDAPPVIADTTPRLRLRERRVHERAPRKAPPAPAFAEPEPSVVDPRPVPWQSVEVQDDGEVWVTFMRGIVERLHSVEVAGNRIVVHVGRLPGAATGPVPAVGIVERTRVHLPLRLLPFIDG